jgi:hypothetical protein
VTRRGEPRQALSPPAGRRWDTVSTTSRRATPTWARAAAGSVGLTAPVVLLLLTGPSGPPRDATSVPLLVLTAAFLVAGLVVIDVEVGEQAHGVTLTEVPLVLGLFFADPLTLLVARVLGQLLALVLLPRQPP